MQILLLPHKSVELRASTFKGGINMALLLRVMPFNWRCNNFAADNQFVSCLGLQMKEKCEKDIG